MSFSFRSHVYVGGLMLMRPTSTCRNDYFECFLQLNLKKWRASSEGGSLSLSTSFLLQKIKDNPVFPNILPKAPEDVTHGEVHVCL